MSSDHKLPATTFAVMGLLSQGPRSGYDLASYAELSIANFWSVAKSQVYRELSRLESLGFVDATEVKQQALPDKRIYSLTKKGQAALIEWLNTPQPQPDRMRSMFLLKVFFGNLIDQEELIGMIEEHGKHARETFIHLSSIVEQLETDPNMEYVLATARLGTKVLEATADWADETIKALKKPTKRKVKKGR